MFDLHSIDVFVKLCEYIYKLFLVSNSQLAKFRMSKSKNACVRTSVIKLGVW